MTKLHGIGLTGLMGLMFCAACAGEAGEAVDDTVVEPALDTRIEFIANKACDRFEECGEIGEGDDQDYKTRDECENDMESSFRDLWPADECSDGRIEATAYDACVSRAETYSCDMGIFEFITYYDECNASDVCTDPAQ